MSARFEPSSSSSSNGGRNQNSRPAPFAVDTHQQVGPGHDGDDTQKVDLGHDDGDPQQVDHDHDDPHQQVDCGGVI